MPEVSLRYLPNKFSVFVPALSHVATYSIVLNRDEPTLVKQFIRKISYNGESKLIKVLLLDLQIFTDEYVDRLYGAGHGFREWNIPEITRQSKPDHEAAMQDFLQQAQVFTENLR